MEQTAEPARGVLLARGGIRGLPKRPLRDGLLVGLVVALLWSPFVVINFWYTSNAQVQSFNTRLQQQGLLLSRSLINDGLALQRFLQMIALDSAVGRTSSELTELLHDWVGFHSGCVAVFQLKDSAINGVSIRGDIRSWDELRGRVEGLQPQLSDRIDGQRDVLKSETALVLPMLQNPVVTTAPFQLDGMSLVLLYGETRLPLSEGGAAFGLLVSLDQHLSPLESTQAARAGELMRISICDQQGKSLLGCDRSELSHPCRCSVPVPGDTWELLSMPRDGWTNWASGLIMVNAGAALAMATAATVVTMQYSRERMAVARELAETNINLSVALEQRMRLEEARDRAFADLARSRQLESVGRLAGGVAHEFNNLLQVILGHTDLLLTAVPTPRPVSDGLQQIERAGKRASELTRQLLAFSSREPASPAVTNLVSAITDGLRLMRPAVKKRTQLEWKAPDADILVPMDGLHFDQILLNLLLNSDLAMPEGGRILLGLRRVAAGEPAGEAGLCEVASVMLTVADQGCGMSPETLSRVFDPFFSTRGPTAGTGLGLSLVYGLMKQCGGRVHLASVENEGTTVTLVFPLVEAAAGGSATEIGS